MKNLLKLSALAAVAVMSATSAFADSVSFNSSSTETFYAGYTSESCSVSSDLTHCTNSGSWNTALPVVGSPLTGGTLAATVAPGTLSPWSSAMGSSAWVSNNAQNGPGGSLGGNDDYYNNLIPNGLYTYYDNFTTTGGTYSGTLSVMADDTTAVYLNGQLLLAAGLVGNDGQCSAALPTCTSVDTITWGSSSNGFNSNGANQLEFVVEQTGYVAEGLDYSGSISTASPVPEPSTLLMFGTGLLGSAGALFRKMRS
jgi:PEP-CTERM motif